MDSAYSIDDEQDPFYIDLNHYLPEALGVDIITTTRSSRAQYMGSDRGVSVKETTEDEAVQLFQRRSRPGQVNGDYKDEVISIVNELRYLALAVTLAGSHVREAPRLLSDVRRYLPEYRAQRQRLLGRKAWSNVHRYSQSVLTTWDASYAAIERQSPVASRLLSLLAFTSLDDISPVFSTPSANH